MEESQGNSRDAQSKVKAISGKTDSTSEPQPIDITSIALRGLFILALLYTAYFARHFLVPVTFALLLSFLLKPVVRFMKRFHIPEPLAALILLLAFLGTVAVGVVYLSGAASKWIAKAPETIDNMENKIRQRFKPASELTQAAEKVEKIKEEQQAGKPPKVEVQGPSLRKTIAKHASSLLLTTAEMLLLLYFLLASGDMLIRRIVKILPGMEEKKEAVEIANETEKQISNYLLMTTLINVVEGVIIAIGMAITGMPNPILWGVMAALLNYIPYLGAWTGIAIITLVAFLRFDTLGQALIPPLIYIAVNISENFLTPILQGKKLRLNPIMVFLAISFWGWLWGIAGVFLAVPILMTFKIFCDHIEPLTPVSEFLSD